MCIEICVPGCQVYCVHPRVHVSVGLHVYDDCSDTIAMSTR